MKDSLYIATASQDKMRIYAAVTTQVVEKARHIHQSFPTATAALGRLLTGTLIMGVMSDNPYRLTVRITGDGPIGEILAASNRRGLVKGYLANPQVDLDLNSQGKLDVSGAVGKGYLTVIKDLGMKEPYQGVVPLHSGEIAEDFAYYFVQSEQTPTAVALGVLVAPDGHVQQAGGLIIQLLPGASETTAAWLEEKLQQMPAITTILSNGRTPLEWVMEISGSSNTVKLLEELDVAFSCDCSKERFLSPLLSLGKHELDDILKEQGKVEVRCHFCNQLYRFSPDELMKQEDGRNA